MMKGLFPLLLFYLPQHTTRWLHWPLRVLFCLSACFLGWLIWPLVQRRWRSTVGLIARRKAELGIQSITREVTREAVMGARRTVAKRTIVLPAAIFSLGVAVVVVPFLWGHHVGYRNGYADAQRDYNRARYHYDKVRIVARYDDRNFVVRPARMDSFHMTTCSQVEWKAGEELEFLDLQYTAACSYVDGRGAFKFVEDEHGKPIKFTDKEITYARY